MDRNKLIRIGTVIRAEEALDLIPQIIDFGFESFSLTFGRAVGKIDLKGLASRLKELLAGKDIIISTISVYNNPLLRSQEGTNAGKDWERLIDHAHLFGTDLVTGFTGRLPEKPVEASIDPFKKVFKRLARRAADKKVRLAFENCRHHNTWEQGGPNIAFNPSAWEMMFEALPVKNLGLEWEPCHQMIQFIDPIAQLRKWAKKIFHIHGKDASIARDVVTSQGIYSPQEYAWHRTPGFGECNWNDIFFILMQNQYKGTVDIEGYHDPVFRDDLEWVGQKKALKYLKECRGE